MSAKVASGLLPAGKDVPFSEIEVTLARLVRDGGGRKRSPARALTAAERQVVLDVLHEPRFVDLAPAEISARLLDEGRYLCSERTM